MRRIILFFMLLCALKSFSQVVDDFSDGDFTENPTWVGTTGNFMIFPEDNSIFKHLVRLDTKSTAASSYLVTKSNAIKDASWEGWFKLTCNPSSGNFACFHLTALTDSLLISKGYYVMIGNTADEISLYRQDSTSNTKIIDGMDKRVDFSSSEIMIKVTRDSLGEWKLYSKLLSQSENDYVLEGAVVDNTYRVSTYSGFFCKNTASNYSKFYFDKIIISGGIYDASTIPIIDNPVVVPPSPTPEPTPASLPAIEQGDLVINEVLFNAGENNEEFVEIYNKSDKLLKLSGLKITTRKGDGTLNTGYKLPSTAQIEPNGYLALCKTAGKDSAFFNSPAESKFAYLSSWPSLSNDGASLVLCNATLDTIYDELTYSPKWHHVLIKNEQGVSLERIHPDLPTQSANSWHSAASEVGYATPGYKNSQYRDISAGNPNKEFWLENENFTPNNDGDKDVLFMHYALADNGWMANITIFDAGGQIILKPYKSFLLGSEGILSWDGKMDTDKLANIGIYVLYVEIFNTAKGETKQFKLPCVVSGK